MLKSRVICLHSLSIPCINYTGITSPEDLLRPVVREANAYAATNASKKWDDTLDPISGGRKPPSHPRHKKSIVLSNNQRRPPPYRHKDKHETAPDDRTEYLYGVSPVYIALLAGNATITHFNMHYSHETISRHNTKACMHVLC